jgi:hypothetical protein
MATFDKDALIGLLNSGDIDTLESLASWAIQPLVELSGGSQYIPVINGERAYEYRMYQDYDGVGGLRTFAQLAIPSNIQSWGTAAPLWKSVLNSVPGTVPVRYYTPNL